MSKIPIPSSFSTSTPPPGSPLPCSNASKDKCNVSGDRLEPPPKDSSSKNHHNRGNDNNNNNNNNNSRWLIPLNAQLILQLESALQIYLYQTKKSSLSYTHLCTLVPKLVLAASSNDDVMKPPPPPPAAEAADGIPSVPAELQGLSSEERLWHDFACVTVPRLYTLVERQTKTGNKKTGSNIVCSLQLQRVHHENRPQELRRLLQEATNKGVRRQLSAKILDWLQKDKIRRQELLHAKAAAAAAANSGAVVDQMALSKDTKDKETVTSGPGGPPQSRPHTTLKALEERVRAKAQERLRHLERAERHAQTTGQQDDRIAIADALYSHARKLLRQRTQGSSRFHTCTRPTITTMTQCKVPFSNVVQEMKGGGYSRQQLSTILPQIAALCPDWISWTVPRGDKNDTATNQPVKEGGGGDDGTMMIPKNATVSIETANYKQVRAMLSGEDSQGGRVVGQREKSSPSSVADQSPFAPAVHLRQGAVMAAAERTPPSFPTATLRAVTVSGTKRSSATAVLDSSSSSMPNHPTNKKVRGRN